MISTERLQTEIHIITLPPIKGAGTLEANKGRGKFQHQASRIQGTQAGVAQKLTTHTVMTLAVRFEKQFVASDYMVSLRAPLLAAAGKSKKQDTAGSPNL